VPRSPAQDDDRWGWGRPEKCDSAFASDRSSYVDNILSCTKGIGEAGEVLWMTVSRGCNFCVPLVDAHCQGKRELSKRVL
jgi:hypothetical protein